MPPIIAAPAMKWSQSVEQLGHQRRRRGRRPRRAGSSGGRRRTCVTGPYLEKLSTPTTSWPRPQQLLDDVAADEAGRAADQDLHASARLSASARLLPRTCSAVSRGPKAKRYQCRYFGIHCATLKFDTPGRPVEPDRRDLGDRQAEPPGLGDQLDADLEAGVGRRCRPARTNVGRVGLERVGGVAGADAGEPAAATGPASRGQQALEQRAADLLAAAACSGRRRRRRRRARPAGPGRRSGAGRRSRRPS